MDYLGGLILGLVIGAGGAILVARRRNRNSSDEGTVLPLLKAHFFPLPLGQLTISERQFPFRVRADLQRAIDRLFGETTSIAHFCGVNREYSHEDLVFSDCVVENQHSPVVTTPPGYEELDIGEAEPVRVLKTGLWLLEQEGVKFAVLLTPKGRYGQVTGMQFQIGVPNSSAGTRITQAFFRHLEDSILKAESYRGKILSLEDAGHSYSGESSGIKVHKLRLVERDHVILPQATLALLERNVIHFVKQRDKLAHFRQATKKGILFYGPPGTGKTHTIHYLARALAGHTTLLISAEQVGLLGEYMTLARLLQPSMVVIEDVDLIARDRRRMNSPCEEILLNKLLNEMDGLKEEADIVFVLTTNRPEALEAALASRPGRIDQAIEFPLPDDEGRAKLVRLYSQGVMLSDEGVSDIASRTEGVSAAFIKELMRRVVQFHIEANGDGNVTRDDIEKALDEMVFKSGWRNLRWIDTDVRG